VSIQLVDPLPEPKPGCTPPSVRPPSAVPALPALGIGNRRLQQQKGAEGDGKRAMDKTNKVVDQTLAALHCRDFCSAGNTSNLFTHRSIPSF
jgi:hypothetical protein